MIVPSTPDSLAGRLLLAMPDMPDPRFRRSVIAMCIHDEGGALGIALGEPVESLGLHELLESFDIVPSGVGDMPVLAGGPMEPRRGFVLHGTDWLTDDSIVIGEDLALTGSLDVLRAIGTGLGPQHFLVALGYAGWGRGQLERELSHPGWFLSAISPRKLFDTAPEGRWAEAFASEGIDPAMLAASSGEA
ncbi:MAG: YqgE/AlgH family protein [Sphingobium sp.]|nr:YqgE/AlgH family protein [Sphingobium sp.]